MEVCVRNIKIPITENENEAFAAAKKRLGIRGNPPCRIVRKAVDARRGQVQFVYHVAVTCPQGFSFSDADSVFVSEESIALPVEGTQKMCGVPVVIGAGPCGLFCALTLAKAGYRPLLLERGFDVDCRAETVNRFFTGGDFCANTNIQFGEGGAGTFSDGKLTCRNGDARLMGILREFVKNGAPQEILYAAMPHIGTDILRNVVKNLREKIISYGGEVRFSSEMTDFCVQNNTVVSVQINNKEEIPCSALVLALGHSARDTYEMLFQKEISMEQKPFSVGVRAEHLQEDINRGRYGKYWDHPALSAADYQLSIREGERGVYTFCMCPGGTVVQAASEPNSVVTNGMSYHARAGKNANAAVCVGVKDFGSTHPLAGMYFQRELEKLAFVAGGKNYSAPIQTLGDFVEGKTTKRLGRVFPTMERGYAFADLNLVLPPDVCGMLKRGFAAFDKKIKGYAARDTVLTGVETRTSAPVRILREENGCAVGINGLYPAGEGAGYAGGIMSAAADGIRCAEKIISTYAPL